MIMFMPMGNGGGDPKAFFAAFIAIFIFCLPGAIYGAVQVCNGVDLFTAYSTGMSMWILFSMIGGTLIAFMGVVCGLAFFILKLFDR